MAYSGQRKIAFDTGFNDALFGRASNNPYNQSVVGGSFQAYSEGYELGLISDTPPRGPKGDQGDPGPAGPAGANGTSGADGADGTSALTGSGAPGAGLGGNGDVYIDNDNGDIWEKSAGVWNLQGSPGNVATAIRTDTVDPAASPEITYRGDAVPGTATSAAAWRVSRLTAADDGDVTIEFADGNDNFDNIWDNRLSLTYS